MRRVFKASKLAWLPVANINGCYATFSAYSSDRAGPVIFFKLGGYAYQGSLLQQFRNNIIVLYFMIVWFGLE